MTCINCGKLMKRGEAPAWTSLYLCPYCPTYLEVHHHDLMSGCMVANSYTWFNNSEKLISYDESREKERINVKQWQS